MNEPRFSLQVQTGEGWEPFHPHEKFALTLDSRFVIGLDMHYNELEWFFFGWCDNHTHYTAPPTCGPCRTAVRHYCSVIGTSGDYVAQWLEERLTPLGPLQATVTARDLMGWGQVFEDRYFTEVKSFSSDETLMSEAKRFAASFLPYLPPLYETNGTP